MEDLFWNFLNSLHKNKYFLFRPRNLPCNRSFPLPTQQSSRLHQPEALLGAGPYYSVFGLLELPSWFPPFNLSLISATTSRAIPKIMMITSHVFFAMASSTA